MSTKTANRGVLIESIVWARAENGPGGEVSLERIRNGLRTLDDGTLQFLNAAVEAAPDAKSHEQEMDDVAAMILDVQHKIKAKLSEYDKQDMSGATYDEENIVKAIADGLHQAAAIVDAGIASIMKKEPLTRVKAMQHKIEKATAQLEKIVCVVEPDRGVVLVDGEAQYDHDPETGVSVYRNEYFTPLGDALIELHKTLKGEA